MTRQGYHLGWMDQVQSISYHSITVDGDVNLKMVKNILGSISSNDIRTNLFVANDERPVKLFERYRDIRHDFHIGESLDLANKTRCLLLLHGDSDQIRQEERNL